ncbi:hypothetical protein BSL78_15973 [Apostichopus japonicus]|uniref:Uncharacterized protein n=1 Tax=Stichopus japonicus TaxID=307972 RepID=A0A2G8KGS7_STIJA|nr:hypothetical protein BSL78_15973 [Apostichopus japonicus]
MSQLLNLNDSELEQLANHMGHDINVHRDYYRLPMEALILAKVSKMLTLSSQEGKIHQYQGKSLDEITVHPDEQLVTASQSDDDDDDNDGDEEDTKDDDNDDDGKHDDEDDDDDGADEDDDDGADDDDVEADDKKARNSKATCRPKYTRWSGVEEKFLFRQKEIKTSWLQEELLENRFAC